MFNSALEETPLSEDFMDDLLEKLETAHAQLVNAFH